MKPASLRLPPFPLSCPLLSPLVPSCPLFPLSSPLSSPLVPSSTQDSLPHLASSLRVYVQFKTLLHTADLLKYRDEIVEGGRALQVQKQLEDKSKEALWMVGVPEAFHAKKRKDNGEKKRMATAQRPSLVSLSSEMLRMRRAIEKGAAMCPTGEDEGA